MKDKFFLNYAIAYYEGRFSDNKLRGRAKEIFNEFLNARDHVFFILSMNEEETITFLLFCAAENGEL